MFNLELIMKIFGIYHLSTLQDQDDKLRSTFIRRKFS